MTQITLSKSWTETFSLREQGLKRSINKIIMEHKERSNTSTSLQTTKAQKNWNYWFCAFQINKKAHRNTSRNISVLY